MRKVIVVLLVGLLLSTLSYSANVNANCTNGKTIAGALAKLSPTGPNTITVIGTCTETVNVQYFDRLSIVGKAGAAVVAPSTTPLSPAITVQDSRGVSISGLTITGTTGATSAVWFTNCQNCRVDNSTVNHLVQVSNLSSVTLSKNAMHTNGDWAGVFVTENSLASVSDTVIDIGGSTYATWSGINASKGATVTITGTSIRGVMTGIAVDAASVDVMGGLGVTDPNANADQTVNLDDNTLWGIYVMRGTVNVYGNTSCPANLKCGTFIRNAGQGVGWGNGINVQGTSSVLVGEGVEISNSKADGITINGTAYLSLTAVRILGSGMNGLSVWDNAVVSAGQGQNGTKIEISGSGQQDLMCGDSAIVHSSSAFSASKIQCPKLQ